MNLKHNGLGRLEKAAPSGIINGSMLDPVAGKATAPRDTLTEVLRSFRETVVESGETRVCGSYYHASGGRCWIMKPLWTGARRRGSLVKRLTEFLSTASLGGR
jgi:hypothetical protein